MCERESLHFNSGRSLKFGGCNDDDDDDRIGPNHARRFLMMPGFRFSEFGFSSFYVLCGEAGGGMSCSRSVGEDEL